MCQWQHDFLNKVKDPSHKKFFENLHDMCSCYGKSPCEYLFPEIECPHFVLLVDTLVYNIGRPSQLKLQSELSLSSMGKLFGG